MINKRFRAAAAATALIFTVAANASAFEVFTADLYLPKTDGSSGLSDKEIASLEMSHKLREFSIFPDREDAGRSAAEFDYRGLHRYLGYGTVVLAGIAAVSSSNRSVHYGAAYAAAGTALGASITGYAAYGRYLNMRRGLFSDNNLHVMLGVLGTAGIATAVLLADSDGGSNHAGIGSAAAISMAVSVAIVRW